MNKPSVILTVIISYIVLAGGVATPFPPCHLSLGLDPACYQPFHTSTQATLHAGVAPSSALRPTRLV